MNPWGAMIASIRSYLILHGLAIPSGMADGLTQTSSTDFPCHLLLAGLPLFHVINVDHVVTLRPSLSDEIP